jgi:beta-lactamase regulating signal transducer with metallopeptidase domain
MHIVLTISLAAILTITLIIWVAFVLARSYLRRQRRMRRELNELRRRQTSDPKYRELKEISNGAVR